MFKLPGSLRVLRCAQLSIACRCWHWFWARSFGHVSHIAVLLNIVSWTLMVVTTLGFRDPPVGGGGTCQTFAFRSVGLESVQGE